MKLCQLVFFINCCFYFSSCATISNFDSYTHADLRQYGLTESEYYREMSLGFALNNNCEKAHESAKISLNFSNIQKIDNSGLNEMYYALASCFYRNKQLGSALEYADKINPQDGYNFRKLILVSEIYIKSGSYKKAAEIYESLYTLSNDLKFKWKVFEMNFQSEMYDLSLVNLDEIQKLKADEYQIFYSKYLVYSKLEKFDKALEMIQKAESYRKYDYSILMLISELQKKLNKWQDLYDTVDLFNRRYSFNYEMTDYYLLSCVKLKKFNEAANAIEKIKNERPYLSFVESDFYPDLEVYFASIDWESKKYDQALSKLKVASQLRPDSVELIQTYSKYLIWSNQVSEAISILEKSYIRHYDNDEIKILKAYAQFKNKNLEEFYKVFDTVVDYKSDHSEIYSIMAEVWFQSEKPLSETESLVNKAMSLNSQNPNLKPILAQIKFKNNDINTAMLMFEQLYNENPEDKLYESFLAEIYTRLHLPNKKFEIENKAIRKPASSY